ncbi:MAG: methylated-DNA--[protein]-cysteine S-methyltransferase [SAR202 cluster bacterium]|nr:methylated-DNA--[protein]-cysteine S-methyltransferase [SAR202 cluster bacterium]
MARWYGTFSTSWGWVAAIGSELGIRHASLPEPTPEAALDHLAAPLRKEAPEHRPGAFEPFRGQLESYFDGGTGRWDVPLDLGDATPFFRRAWAACQTIPAGETRTYAWLAARAGNPAASRAAGSAMARNRVPIVIPCHRVLGTDGGLHGFAGTVGLPLKERLLRLEGVRR